MTLSELYLLIGLPDGVIAQLNEYEENRTCEIPLDIKEKLCLLAASSSCVYSEALKDKQFFDVKVIAVSPSVMVTCLQPK